MTEIERLIDMLGCGNTMPQERIRWANSLVALARAAGAEQMKQQIRDSVPVGYSILTAPVPPIKYVMVPASVLAPKEK